MEATLQPPTPQPPRGCSSPGPAGKSCWNLDLWVVVLLVALAGAVILLLLYQLLHLRHRLKLARARHSLEYSSFYHTATYTLKQPKPCQKLLVKTGTVPEATPLIQTITTITPAVTTVASPPSVAPPPLLPLPSPPVLPPPPSVPLTPVLSLPLPLPVSHTIPPSPHLSWGACSDADVYSQIGVFRPSRLPSLSSQSTVILFEHSSL